MDTYNDITKAVYLMSPNAFCVGTALGIALMIFFFVKVSSGPLVHPEDPEPVEAQYPEEAEEPFIPTVASEDEEEEEEDEEEEPSDEVPPKKKKARVRNKLGITSRRRSARLASKEDED